MRTLALLSVASLSCLALACGGVENQPTSSSSSTSSSSGQGGGGGAGGAVTGGGGSGGAGGFETAPHQPFPTVSAFGGPVLAHPNIVTVTFAGYEHEAEVQAFDTWIATSDWLTTTGADYGVSAGAHVTSVVLAEAAPATATDDDSSTLLVARIQDGTLPDPATLENPYYVLYYPNSTVVSDFNGAPSCTIDNTAGGYHWESAWLGTRFSYGVLPTCSTDPNKAIGYIETSSGHELIEASTDPFPETATGWVFYDPTSLWSALPGEVGDLCEFESGATYGNFQVPRVWSNSAAMAGVDPCIPAAKGQPLYDVTATPTMVPTVQPGSSQTFELTGWSTEDIPAWKLEAVAWGYGFTPTVSLEKATIKNGETIKATLTVPANAPAQSQGQAMIYSIRDLAAGEYNQWPITVRTP